MHNFKHSVCVYMLRAESRTEQTCSDVCGCVLDSICVLVLYTVYCIVYCVSHQDQSAPVEHDA